MSKLEFSEQEQLKASIRVEALRSQLPPRHSYAYRIVANDLQCRLSRAEELLQKSRPSCRNQFCWCESSRDMENFGHSEVCREINDFLTALREERGEQ